MKPTPELRAELVKLKKELIFQKMKINREKDELKLVELEEEYNRLSENHKDLKKRILKDYSEQRRENEENEKNIRR